MKYDEIKTKITIVLGYILLIVLLLVGITSITYQVKKLSVIKKEKDESENLITVSYVLATLYKAESFRNIAYASNEQTNYRAYNQSDSLISIVKKGITYLKYHSENQEFSQKLDSVDVLLVLKTDNEQKIMQLVDSIMNLPMQKRMHTTVLSKKELDNLSSVIKNRDMRLMDSTHVVTKTKSFGEKFGDLFRRHTTDSVHIQKSQQSDTVTGIIPIDITLDTISEFITDYIFERKREVFKMTAALSARQLELQSTNEMLFNKINQILRSLEEHELQTKEQIAQKEKEMLLISNRIGYIIAFVAIIIAISFIIITLRLINQQQNYRKKLENQNEEIEKLLKTREWLMLAMSHDIKAPISSIIGYADMLEKSNLNEKEKKYIVNLKNSSLQVIELVNNLINFHKMEQGKLSANFSEVSPYNIVNEIFTSFKPIAKAKNLNLILKNAFPENLLCQTDFIFVNQIVNNLVFNALKFTSNGEVEISGQLGHNENRNELIISVRDTGIGIAPDDIKKLFNEFERAQSSEIQHIEGSGLGLSISKKLAELIDGKISVTSTKGQGSTFTLCVAVQDVILHKNISQRNKQKTSNKKLLFIDDDLLMLKVCQQMAEQLNFNAYTTDNVNDMFNILNNNRIDIIFCDLKMSETNGFLMINNIKNNIENPPLVVALSASATYSEKELKQNGFGGFLQKPLNISDLESIISQLILNKKNEKKRENQSIELHHDIDFTSLIAYAQGDNSASKMILETFISENTKIAQQIERAIIKGNKVLIQNLAHKILPRMRMINNLEIVDILHKIEKGETTIAKKDNLTQLIEEVNVNAQQFIDNNLN
ncbi:MAG: hybrid sensor histidine kinase/response regulator [Paludibacter sp.]|nr:hybrid sensor histidine kinase/response regulator [Paludibacter sp.]